MTKRRQVMFAMLIAAAPAWGIDIITCNTTIPAGETGVLQVDLDCAPTSVPAVQVRRYRGGEHPGRDVVASDNIGPSPNSAGGNAIFSSGSIVLTNLVAMNNTNPGISGVRVKLIDSTVTNNGLRGPHFMVDIETERRPVLVNSVCLHSEVSPTGGDWDVCVDD